MAAVTTEAMQGDLSAPVPTFDRMINPWRRLRALSDYTLLWHDDGPMGETDFVDKTISLRRGMTYEERRCTVMHETLHAERGPVTAGMVGREELIVQKETARRLLPSVRAIGDAYAWALGDDEAAAVELGVDVDVLLTRLKYMTHPAERAYLMRRFGTNEEEED